MFAIPKTSYRNLAALLSLLLLLANSGCKSAAMKEIESSDNLKELFEAIDTYATANHKFPDNLDQVKSQIGKTGPVGIIGKGHDFAFLMTNPITGANPGYEYVKPPSTPASIVSTQNQDVIILYQLRDGKRDTTLPVCYLTGSVRKMGS